MCGFTLSDTSRDRHGYSSHGKQVTVLEQRDEELESTVTV